MAERFTGQVICLTLEGMNGPSDARLLELSLSAVQGVQGVLIDPDNKLVTLYADQQLDPKAVTGAISVLGAGCIAASNPSSPLAGLVPPKC